MVEVYSDKLSQLLTDSEDHTLDYKSSDVITSRKDGHRHDIARHLVGFANRDGGRLIFGVDDDSRKPDEEYIKKEVAEETLSEIAEDRCSPPVEYRTEEFYSADAGHLSDGSILVVRVNRNNGIPSAVVNNSGNYVEEREYRVRAGDQTRLVKDEELRQMFLGQLDPDKEQVIKTWYFYTTDDPAPSYHPELWQSHRPLNASFSQRSIAQYLTQIPEEDKRRWIPEGARGLSNLVSEIIPLAIINQLSGAFRDTWHIEWTDHKISGRGKPPGIQTEVIEVDQSKFDSDAFYSLNKANLDWYSLYTEFGNEILAPIGTDIQIVNSGSRPYLVFKKDNKFDVKIGLQWEQYNTIPQGHPYSGIKAAKQKHGSSLDDDWLSIEMGIKISAEYGFPDISDKHIDSHKSFIDQIQNIICHYWSIDTVTEDLPSKEVYEINEKVDVLLERMDEFLSVEK